MMTKPSHDSSLIPSSLIAAAVRLVDVLATENAALAALNMPAAARLLPEKIAAAVSASPPASAASA